MRDIAAFALTDRLPNSTNQFVQIKRLGKILNRKIFARTDGRVESVLRG